METRGAGAAVGAGEDRLRPEGVAHPRQFAGQQVEGGIPLALDERVADLAALRPGTVVQPGAPDHRLQAAGLVSQRTAAIAEDRCRRRIALIWLEGDVATLPPRRERPPIGAVGETPGTRPWVETA